MTASPRSIEILGADELHRLFASLPALEEFGSGSARPLLAVDARGIDAALAAQLAALPCPVVAVGETAHDRAFDAVVADPARLRTIAARVAAAPMAAMVLVQHLRASAGLDLRAALSAESMAYATVQTGPEFRAWLARRDPAAPAPPTPGAPVEIAREGRTLTLTLNRPGNRNAIDVAMRDALCEAFDLAAALPGEFDRIVLAGAGRCFSIGGDLSEFGQARDPATAHWIRSIRLPANRLLPFADKLEARIHGAAIGAGIEIAAFAKRVVARPNAWFQLPELAFGLIPGAGGTVSVTRRVGRHRAAEMMLSGRRVGAAEALSMGLIDAIEDW